MNNQLPLIDIFQLSDIALAYFAGLFDGEGTITISPTNTKNSYVFGLAVGMTNAKAVNELCLAFGGRVGMRTYSNSKWRPLYTWYVYGKRAESVLRALIPYLRIKKEEADLAIRLRSYNHRVGQGENRQRIVDEIRKIRHS